MIQRGRHTTTTSSQVGCFKCLLCLAAEPERVSELASLVPALHEGESQWELPAEMAWSKHEHEGSHFWFNSETGENTWDEPHHEAWEQHDSDL